MEDRPRRLRIQALVLLCLHLAAVLAGPVIDVRAELDALASRSGPSHFHDADSVPCRTSGHTHDLCLLSALGSMQVGSAASVAIVIAGADLRHPVASETRLPSRSPLLPLGARAPPSV